MAYLALDLGAGSGRAIVGEIKNNKLILDEVYRFPNKQVLLGNTLYWDFPTLFSEIKKGISKAVQKGYSLKGIAVDTWGVDFGLLDSKGQLLSNPVCYRDVRTKNILESAFKKISKEELYQCTGNQLMEINTAFQLFSMVQSNNSILPVANKLLFTPDLINYFLTGFIGNEYTIASTSQLLNAQTRKWEPKVFNALNIPQNLVSELVTPGTIIGKLRAEIASETGAYDAEVIAVGSHDTASAIAAIPATKNNWAFLSSGTWSLVGMETQNAILTNEAMNNNFTNEGGVGNKIRFLSNINGLWLLQRLLDEHENATKKPIQYDSLLANASSTKSIDCILNPDDPLFSNPKSMHKAIDLYCIQNHLPIPCTLGEYVRTILESLAFKYNQVLTNLKQYSAKPIEHLYIVGGGCKNNLLNQLTANTTQLPIFAASPESTSLGNIMLQAIAKGELNSIQEGRELIANSISIQTYYPQ